MKPSVPLKIFIASKRWTMNISTFEETRFKMIAMLRWRILVVVYTMRDERYRIISSR
jgi:uncharacterized DUF497 family protein